MKLNNNDQPTEELFDDLHLRFGRVVDGVFIPCTPENIKDLREVIENENSK